MKAQEEEANFTFPDDLALGLNQPLTRAQLLSTRIECGAFSGFRVIELPAKQLRWLAFKSKSVNDRLRQAIKELLEWLDEEGYGPASHRELLINGPALAEEWKEEMLQRHHPEVAAVWCPRVSIVAPTPRP